VKLLLQKQSAPLEKQDFSMTDSSDKSDEIIEILRACRNGSHEAVNELVPIIYAELRRLAHSHFSRERQNHTLQTTALVHEAYIKLVADSSQNWENRAHFFGAASRLMREILIQYAREKNRLKRGGGYKRVSNDEVDKVPAAEKEEDWVRLDEALRKLAKVDQVLAEIVEKRYFAGLTNEEIAEVMNISLATVKRKWQLAKAWLFREMKR
jgi:RNA polymerase sigma factor (TIGR02999 family)